MTAVRLLPALLLALTPLAAAQEAPVRLVAADGEGTEGALLGQDDAGWRVRAGGLTCDARGADVRSGRGAAMLAPWLAASSSSASSRSPAAPRRGRAAR